MNTVEASAVMSGCEKYRYSLRRSWDPGLPKRCLWVMLNPSTADGELDDPTIRRCMTLSNRMNCGSLEVVNLFAYRATDPKKMNTVHAAGYDVVGHFNDEYWRNAIIASQAIVVAWGAQPLAKRQAPRFRALLRDMSRTALCLGTTQSGAPRHPLYVKGNTEFVPWEIN